MIHRRLWSSLFFALLFLAAPFHLRADVDVITDFAGADVNIGERLFLETRFSQYFFTNSYGDANYTPPGDPTVATLTTITNLVPGPFAGQAINCRQCHLVDEKGYGQFGDGTLGNRTYADFARRSPVPPRDDGRTLTTRNSPTLVDALLPRSTPLFLHHDGQFASAHDLIIGTLTGRNYGWKPEEYSTAVHHIASIIRDDDGMGYLASMARDSRFRVNDTFLAAYANVFSGFTDYNGSYIWDPRSLTADLISPELQLDMRYATDEQILDDIANLIESYLHNLTFSQATNGVDFVGVGTPIFNGSPFDVFLIKNNLPQLPATNETSAQYSRRLLRLVDHLSPPQFVTDPDDGSFTTHTQTFKFGHKELEGLKIFLNDKVSACDNHRANVGNCAACHSLPAFTDFIFHNTGAAQEEYDALHGPGSFKRIHVPDLATRQTNYDAYLPPSTNHPYATGVFDSPPATNLPGQVDLGLWNIYLNPDIPGPQAGLAQIVPQLLGLTLPQIESNSMTGGHFNLRGGNGVPGGQFYVLASASPSLAASWRVIATNTFDADGRFDFRAPLTPGMSLTFYKLSLALPAPAEALARTIALFKTPTLRDLGQSGPYLHTGRKDSLRDVVRFYQEFSAKARLGQVRNAAPELRDIHLDDTAIEPLAAFLRSLNEDYTD